MKFVATTIALAALAELASAHCMHTITPRKASSLTVLDIFQTLTANGVKGGLFQNIRPVPVRNSHVWIACETCTDPTFRTTRL
jgi:hypothetical protein